MAKRKKVTTHGRTAKKKAKMRDLVPAKGAQAVRGGADLESAGEELKTALVRRGRLSN